MKQLSKASIVLLFLFLQGISSPVFGAVTLPWGTTFDCSETTQPNNVNCDSLAWYSNNFFDINRSLITTVANNPIGNGGRGARFWVGDGTNKNSASLEGTFSSPQKELWIRWYMRYENNFQWSGLNYDKMLYINTGTPGISVIPEWYTNRYAVIAQGTPNYYQVQSTSSGGWDAIIGGKSGGEWHSFEIYIKMDSNQSNGIGRLWIDGVLHASNNSVNWSGGDPTAQQGWLNFHFHSNQASPGNSQSMYVDYDDLAVYNTKPPSLDAQGNPFIGLISGSVITTPPVTTPPVTTPPVTTPPVTTSPAVPTIVLFKDTFEDGSFSGRGWYDNTSPVLSTTEAVTGSTKSLEFRFPVGAAKPTSGGAMRMKFTETDSVLVSYYVKYSANWQGSNRDYHPHEFYLLTNKSSDWSGLAFTPLTAYIEQNEGVPRISIQDGVNIDQSRIGQDLTSVSENRGVAGCNGDSDGFGSGTCYQSGSSYVNGKDWRAEKIYFADASGPYYKNDWHKVDAYIKLNSIANGKAVADGVIQYWFDGEQVLNHNNVILRTAQYPDMKFNQFVIAPWIGDGSPVDQTFWVDDLTVASGLSVEVSAPGLSAPKGLMITRTQ